jgi:hypothetical protein
MLAPFAPVSHTVGQPSIIKKEIVMIDALSTPGNKNKTVILIVVCGLLTIVSVVIGIDDNPPGLLLAFLAAAAFVLAFVHPWRTVRKFMYLLLASVVGFVLFVILSITLDSVTQNPTTSSVIKNLIESPTVNVINIIIIMLCAAALVVGAIGAVVMFIRSRRQTM